jgi:hypothetical protein
VLGNKRLYISYDFASDSCLNGCLIHLSYLPTCPVLPLYSLSDVKSRGSHANDVQSHVHEDPVLFNINIPHRRIDWFDRLVAFDTPSPVYFTYVLFNLQFSRSVGHHRDIS